MVFGYFNIIGVPAPRAVFGSHNQGLLGAW